MFDFENGEMILREVAKEFSVDDIKKNTEGEFKVANNVKTF